jgi:hypothetical protein
MPDEKLTANDVVREIYEANEVELTPRVVELLDRYVSQQLAQSKAEHERVERFDVPTILALLQKDWDARGIEDELGMGQRYHEQMVLEACREIAAERSVPEKRLQPRAEARAAHRSANS